MSLLPISEDDEPSSPNKFAKSDAFTPSTSPSLQPSSFGGGASSLLTLSPATYTFTPPPVPSLLLSSSATSASSTNYSYSLFSQSASAASSSSVSSLSAALPPTHPHVNVPRSGSVDMKTKHRSDSIVLEPISAVNEETCDAPHMGHRRTTSMSYESEVHMKMEELAKRMTAVEIEWQQAELVVSKATGVVMEIKQKLDEAEAKLRDATRVSLEHKRRLEELAAERLRLQATQSVKVAVIIHVRPDPKDRTQCVAELRWDFCETKETRAARALREARSMPRRLSVVGKDKEIQLLSRTLQQRVDIRARLTARSILLSETGSSTFQKRKEQTLSKLNAMLTNRPTYERLQQLNVIKEEDEKRAKSLSATKDRLDALFSARPSQDAIKQTRRVALSDADVKEKQTVLTQTREALAGRLTSRPSPQQLLSQRIIADIGDLPSASNRDKNNNQLIPALVDSLKGISVRAVKCGFAHTGVIDDKGNLYMFGLNANGRLGVDEKKMDSSVKPVLVSEFKGAGVEGVDLGDHYTAAWSKGQLFMFGMNTWGTLGLGHQSDVSIPQPVVALRDEKVKIVACGQYHTLVLTGTSNVYTFGWNKNGRLGIGSNQAITVTTPTLLKSLSELHVLHVSAGQNASLALDDEGKVYTWGGGAWGNLGHGDEKDQLEPKAIVALKDKCITHAVLGSTHALALADTGELYSWGQNRDHQLGRDEKDSKYTWTPGVVPFDEKKGTITHIACGKSHSACVRDGLLYTWGKGSSGMLGHGNENQVSKPTLVATLKTKTLKSVECGWCHTIALTSDGQVFAFGGKDYGRLGL